MIIMFMPLDNVDTSHNISIELTKRLLSDPYYHHSVFWLHSFKNLGESLFHSLGVSLTNVYIHRRENINIVYILNIDK